ncbi:MAG: ABC transporter, ATP-binding protein [uncultured Sulfurovum sp.]|uniref:ABC transporter, ATP-binding protein n=1 Tax=uncultured Sulfurovum sp. TaxID=269237 RepID=A0A6S6U4Z8_9BACT|nr:MAG: ABC transporter, ATP-binding protein [uncultured Sulfurovum sp.]
MELQLKNIGMIKEANVKLDGLTVIAGENDTGKSTVGKVFYVLVKGMKLFVSEWKEKNAENLSTSLLAVYFLLFKKTKLENNASMLFKDKEDELVELKGQDYTSDKDHTHGVSFCKKTKIEDIVFLETPLVWSFTDFFRDIAQVESQMNIKLDYPYLMKDLTFKLHIKNASNGLDIRDKVIPLMGGEFKKDEVGRYYFDKNGQRIELVNTATGIKYFGIFQVLSQNNYLNKDTVLVLDEPEVHLHPKWQLKMAELIVDLVKNGIKILVNSHSPYMIEALQRYGELSEINADFYLAEDAYIKKENDSNSETLAKIFEKLSEPFDVFEEMESERFQNG